jgi:hypothetical protein
LPKIAFAIALGATLFTSVRAQDAPPKFLSSSRALMTGLG